jgi:phospholipid/cholesterol/gamma-HCH transport system substrate-binding protein
MSRRGKGLAAAAIFSIVAVVVAVNTGGDSKPRHQLVAQFADASPLLVGNDVRMDGVKVGTISRMRLVSGQAEVTMQLSAAAYPLHTDARVTVRPVSLLGERFVDLDRGTPKAPALAEGSILPASQSGQATDLDQVLNALDDPTGEALAALVTVLGQGADGNGKNIAAAVKALKPAMTRTRQLVAVLDEQNDLLLSTLDSVGPVADALASDNGKTLDALVASADRLLGKTSANELALRQTIAQLPRTVATARSTLEALSGTGRAATPTLKALRPLTDDLSQVSQELADFAAAADPALASATPVLQKARALLTEAAPVVTALSAAGPAAVSAAHSLRPIVGDLADNIGNVLDFVKFWALTTNGYDGMSHYFRAMLMVSPLSVTGLVPGLGTNLGVGGQPPGGNVTPRQPKGLLPGVTNTVGGLVNSVLGGILSPKASTDGGVTGMTPQQEQGGLLSLLGLGG